MATEIAEDLHDAGVAAGAGRRRRAWLYRMLRRLHVAIFAVTALPLAVTSLTGALLVFGHEVEALLTPPADVAASAGEPLAPTALLARIAEQRPDVRVWAVTMPEAPSAPWTLWLAGGAGRLEVDPGSGVILRDVRSNEGFYDFVRAIHRRWLADGRPLSDWTRTIISSTSLALIVQIVVGVWMWALPGKRLQRLKPAFGRSRRLLWQRLHMASGVATAAPLLLVAYTGLSMYWKDSTQAMVETLTGSQVEKLEKPDTSGLAPAADLDAAVALGRGLIPEAAVASYRPAGEPGEPVHVGLRTADSSVNSLAWIGDDPPRVLAFYDGREASLATRVWQFQYWLHIGDFAGWPVRALWLLVALAPLGFVASGLWLWRDRRRLRAAGVR